jgi:hypothetical protein
VRIDLAKLVVGLRLTAMLLAITLLALTAACVHLGRASTGSAPVVSGISPPVGPLAGGTTLGISGSGFTDASAVDFGSAAAQSFTVVSDSQITATSPAGSGTVNVTVTTGGGTSATGSSAEEYTYVALPAVTKVSPASGPRAGGTLVTVTGTGFTGASVVDFGSAPAQSVTVLTDATLTALSPAGAAGAVDVTVTTPDGTSATDGADRFSYDLPPAIAAVGPGVEPTSATLHATVDAGALPLTACQFQYGTTRRYGRAVACVLSPGGSASSRAVSALLNGLAPVTEYHYRLTVSTAAGTSTGPDETFSTPQLQAGPAPLVGLLLEPLTGRPGVIGELLGVQGISGAIRGESIVLRCITACSAPLALGIPLRGGDLARRRFTLAHALLLSAATRIEIDISASGKLSRYARYAFASAGTSIAVRIIASGCLSGAAKVVKCPV